MKSRIVKALQYIVFLFLGFILLYFSFRGINLADIVIKIKQANYQWVALSLLCAILALIFRTWRWKMLIAPIKKDTPSLNIFYAINIGYLANFAFPRIGEITRCGVLNRTDKIPIDNLLGTVIVERTFDLLVTLIMLCSILFLRFKETGVFLQRNILYPISEKIPALTNIWVVFLIVILTVISIYLLYKIFKEQIRKIRALQKVKSIAKGVINGIRSIFQIKNPGLFIFSNFAIFGMYYLQTYIMFFALNITSSLQAVDALFILVLSSLSFIIPTQGGIGAYHGIVSTGLLLLGIAIEDGMAYATLSHLTTSLLLIFLGTMSLIFLFFKSKRINSVYQ